VSFHGDNFVCSYSHFRHVTSRHITLNINSLHCNRLNCEPAFVVVCLLYLLPGRVGSLFVQTLRVHGRENFGQGSVLLNFLFDIRNVDCDSYYLFLHANFRNIGGGAVGGSTYFRSTIVLYL
jgi:hypothetical protein